MAISTCHIPTAIAMGHLRPHPLLDWPRQKQSLPELCPSGRGKRVQSGGYSAAQYQRRNFSAGWASVTLLIVQQSSNSSEDLDGMRIAIPILCVPSLTLNQDGFLMHFRG